MSSKDLTGKSTAGEPDETAAGGEPAEADGRKARLAQALRANLLKRKAKARAERGLPTPPEGGRQT
jgi:hypothetical protein